MGDEPTCPTAESECVPRLSYAALAATLVAAALTASALAANGIAAKDPCGNTVMFTQPFKPFGDPATYVAVPGASFESGAPAWTLAGGAAVVSGNESYRVAGPTDSRSLSLPAGASATSPSMCIGPMYPTLRLFGLNTGNPTSTLRVDLLWTNTGGIPKVFLAGRFTATGSWQPSPIVLFNPNMLGPTGGMTVKFKLTVEGAGSWRADDMYVDPARHR
jgi:hypothetical protein